LFIIDFLDAKMNPSRPLLLVSALLVLLSPPTLAKKKKKNLFDSGTLKCLVCQSVVDEFVYAIGKVDPRKKSETGTFRLNGDGEQKRSAVSYI
jgi:hypothetical protein